MADGVIELEPSRCCLCGVDDSQAIASGKDFDHDTVTAPVTMVRCNRCGMYYLNPRPTSEFLEQLYPPDYMSYGEFGRKASALTQAALNVVLRRRAASLIKHFPLSEELKVFDVGCGEGTLLTALRDSAMNASWSFAGCELNSDVVQVGREQGLDVVLGRFEELDLPESAYDVVLMSHIIEHLADPVAALRKACHITRDGGILVVETPNTASLDARFFRRRCWFDYQFPRHWYVFNPSNLRGALELAGYHVVNVLRQVGPMCWLYSVRNCISDIRVLRPFLPLVSRWNPVGLAAFTVLDYGIKIVHDTSRMQLIARKTARSEAQE